MKKALLTGVIAALFALPVQAMSEKQPIPTNEEARSIAKEFVGQLQPELKKGMKAGGPMNAIEVCHTKAPQIALELSQKTGWEINRVSHKPRGATATADAWETEVLKKFMADLQGGADIKKLEFSEVTHDAGKSEFRYMKAIPTGAVCLKCHGANVAAPVKAAIQKYYPQDMATGFAKGDMRGAFSFTKALD